MIEGKMSLKKLNNVIFIIALSLTSSYSFAVTVNTLATLSTELNDSVAVDVNDNIYISNTGVFTPDGGLGTEVFKVTPDGTVSLFATISSPGGNSVDGNNNLYINGKLSSGGNGIFKITPEGNATEFSSSSGIIKWNSKGDAFAINYGSGSVFEVDEQGEFTVFSTPSFMNGPTGIAFDENDQLYIGNFNDGRVFIVNDDGSAEMLGTVPGGLGYMTYMSGKIYATGFNNNRIYSISMSGEVDIVAGDGTVGQVDGNGESARFSRPNGIAALSDGLTLVISEYGAGAKSIRTITIDAEQQIVQVANDDDISVDEDERFTFNVIENDDGFPNQLDPSTIQIVQMPNYGSAEINVETGIITYLGDTDYFGEDSFTYTVENIAGAMSNEATVTINIAALADEPVSVDDTVSTQKNMAVSINVLTNDSDPDLGTLSYANLSITVQPTSGVVSVDTDSVMYTPNTDYTGDDSFSYAVSNDSGMTSAAALVSVTVNDVTSSLEPPEPAKPVEQPNSSGGSLSQYLTVLLIGGLLLRKRQRCRQS